MLAQKIRKDFQKAKKIKAFNNLKCLSKLSSRHFTIKLRLCRYIRYNFSTRSILHRCVLSYDAFGIRGVHIEWAGDTRPVTGHPPRIKFTVRNWSDMSESKIHHIWSFKPIKYNYVPQALWLLACYSTCHLNQAKFPRAPFTGFNISVGSQQATVTETRDIAAWILKS